MKRGRTGVHSGGDDRHGGASGKRRHGRREEQTDLTTPSQTHWCEKCHQGTAEAWNFFCQACIERYTPETQAGHEGVDGVHPREAEA